MSLNYVATFCLLNGMNQQHYNYFIPLGRIFLHTWHSTWIEKFYTFASVRKSITFLHSSKGPFATVKKSTLIPCQFFIFRFMSNSYCTKSIHPDSWDKTTYPTAKRPFMSLENSRSLTSLAPCGRSRNKMSRVFSWNKKDFIAVG